MTWPDYIRQIQDRRATGQATEHSYRPALEALLEALGGTGIQAINDPSHGDYGAPDFIVQRNGVPVGHVECKNVGVDLDDAEETEQLTRYRRALPNLILTDYLEFRWYAAGQLRLQARLGRFDSSGRLRQERSGRKLVEQLLENFFNAEDTIIADPAELARRMAGKAQLLRNSIQKILGQGDAKPSDLQELLASFREVLISDLDVDTFADLQAQTAAYGLFAARCIHDGSASSFTRQSAVFAQTTPFLRDVFNHVAGPIADQRITWIVDDLAFLLARADMEAILKNFGSRTRQEDPVVHFYEDFLHAYDPKLRELRGVYYTPEPVVSYIVRSVHRLLQDKFALKDGLADTSTVSVKTENAGSRAVPRVLILDPAAGTGTFLREVVSQMRRHLEQAGSAGAWQSYVQDHLLPRIFGFELMMAPYAVCHLKLALELGGDSGRFTLPKQGRLGVFLTNSLEEAHETVIGPMFAAEIARESRDADAVKREKPVMVVVGNPPYSGHSANKGEWIRSLIEDYKHNIPELKKPGQAKWLSDDYVKFIRFAQWRIEKTGEGVLGFVTNHSYLDNPTFRGMRRSLMNTFDEVWLLNLHGNARKKERAPNGGPDENVFDIQQGVAIGLFVKRKKGSIKPARVFHADLWGERERGPDGGKYGWLAANDVFSTDWTEVAARAPHHLFVPRDEALAKEYESGWSIRTIFSPNGDPAPGIVTTHDQFAISWTRSESVAKVERLLSTRSEDEARSIWRLCSQKQWRYERAKKELASQEWRGRIHPILYRPFDIRTTVYDRNVAVHRRERVMRHMLAGPNVAISTTRNTEIAGGWEHVFVASNLTQHHTVSNKEVNYLFPLYLYPQESEKMSLGDAPERSLNLSLGFTGALANAVGLRFVPDGRGDLQSTFGPENAFHYIYAVLHSPEYRRRYADFLRSDFPRIPLPQDRAVFAKLAPLGAELVSLHLMEDEGSDKPDFDIEGSNRVDRVRYAPPSGDTPGRVWINSRQYFEGVSPEMWGFTIGGYRPAEKWLKDRKGRTLSFDDLEWYRRVCAVLSETPRLMACIDEGMVECGGSLGKRDSCPRPE